MPIDREEVRRRVGIQRQLDSLDRAEVRRRVGLSGPEDDPAKVAETNLGANFDPENFAPAKLRWAIARGDTLEEKNLRLKKIYPEGNVRVIRRSVFNPELSDDPVMVWRESPNDQYKRVEKPGFDWMDIPEAVAQSMESIIGETAVAFATRGVTVPQIVMRQAGGAMAGEAVEQSLQFAGGVQAQDLGEMMGEVATEGGLSAIGGFTAGSAMTFITNVGRGAGGLRVGQLGEETIRAADRLGLRRLMTPGLTSDNPIVRIQEKQAAAILPAIGRRYFEIVKSLDEAMRKNIPSVIDKARDSVVAGMERYGREILAKTGARRTTARRGGQALQKGIAEYDTVTYNLVGDLYGSARKIEEPIFDFQGLTNLAKDLRAGVKGTLDSDVDDLLKQIENIKGPLETTEGVVTVTDQLRNVRTQAFAIKHVSPGDVATQRSGQANDLFHAITDTLEYPKNQTPGFIKAWRTANDNARNRFKTLGQLAVVQAVKSEAPAKLARSLAKKFEVDNLLAIRNVVSPKYWRDFTESFKSDLLANPAGLSKRLQEFDDETLNVLMPRAEQALWKNVAKEYDRILATGVDDIAERTVKNKDFIGELIEGASQRNVETFLLAAASHRNPAMVDSIRAGMFDWVWDGVVVPQKAQLTIDLPRFRGRIKKLQKSGLWDVLTPEQRLVIQDAKTLSVAMQQIADAGTSIRAAEIAPNVLRLNPSAVVSVVQSGITSRIYMSRVGRNLLIGTGKDSTQGQLLRALGGALAQVSNIEDITELE